MKLALIPPRDRLHEAELLTGYHLLLPQHCDDKEYLGFYQWRRAAGDFLILDNGACEGKLVDDLKLMEIAHTYMVNEVVVPDVLGDMKTTLAKAEAFEDVANANHEFNYMAVLQGQTLDEFKQCADEMAELSYISTYAIPRHIETTCGHGSRLAIANYLHMNHDDRDIHLLGTNPECMFEMGTYRDAYNFIGVRGVDTASPYYYAMAGENIVYKNVVTRPEDYYERVLTSDEDALVVTNTAVMKMWVGR